MRLCLIKEGPNWLAQSQGDVDGRGVYSLALQIGRQKVAESVHERDVGERRCDQNRRLLKGGAEIHVKLVPLAEHAAGVAVDKPVSDPPLVWLQRYPSQRCVDHFC